MAVIAPEAASLLKLVVDDFEIIGDCIASDPSAYVFGSTLAPWPNRLEDGRYLFAGRQFSFPNLDAQQNKNHGLLLSEKFDVVETKDAISLGYRFGSDSGYPFDVDLTIRYSLFSDGLKVEAIAENHGEAAPFAIGFHPYFLTGPKFKLRAEFTHRGISNERLLPVAIEPIPGLRLNQDSEDLEKLDHCFMGASEVFVERPEVSFVVRALENLPYFMLYRPTDQLFAGGSAIAIEPMSAPANIFRNDIGSVTLAPKEIKRFSYEIRKL